MKKWNIICVAVAAVFLTIGAFYFLQKQRQTDRTAPVITMESETVTCKISDGEEKLLAGITASDDIDGDLTDSVQINRIRKTTDEKVANQFEITYVVFDSSNNIATASRTLIFSDYTPPRIELDSSPQFNSISSVNLYSSLRAIDAIDGNISSQLAIEMSDEFVNAISTGTYSCTVRVTNSMGDTSVVPLTFDVLEPDMTQPVLYLNRYIVYINRKDDFDPRNYLDSVVIDGDKYMFQDKASDSGSIPYNYGYLDETGRCVIPMEDVSISSDVNTNQAGTYSVSYSFQHPSAGTNGFVRMVVVVM